MTDFLPVHRMSLVGLSILLVVFRSRLHQFTAAPDVWYSARDAAKGALGLLGVTLKLADLTAALMGWTLTYSRFC